MELEYQSDHETPYLEGKNNLALSISNVDKKYGSIILSTPHLSQSKETLSLSIKKKILTLIREDKKEKLLRFMKKKNIKLTDEIGKEGLGWNVLHFIARHNAVNCLEVCLKNQFQESPKTYHRLLETKNVDEDTALLIAFQHNSNAVIQKMLQLGGVDIYAINLKKATPYQLALNSQNEEGLQLLMKYQLKAKQKDYLNIKQLNTIIELEEERCCCFCIRCLFCCFWVQQSTTHIEINSENQTERRVTTRTNLPLQQMGIFEIEWKQRQLPLFDKTNPFLIRQSCMVVSHLLILFQCLAQHLQIVEKLIYKVGEKYYVHFYTLNEGNRIIWVDNLFPFLNHTEESMFLSLEGQLWPMVLQKGLCQLYSGYFEPGKIPLHNIIEAVTGNSVHRVAISSFSSSAEVIQKLAKLSEYNFFYVLESQQNKPLLHCPEGRKQCFSVLKIVNNKILINCPFVNDLGKQRESQETIEMKMMKIHYRNPNTMAIWVSVEQFRNLFTQIVFCHTLNSSLPKKTSQKFQVSNNKLYFHIRLNKKMRERNHQLLSIFSLGEKSYVGIQQVRGWCIFDEKTVKKLECECLGDALMTLQPKTRELILQIITHNMIQDEIMVSIQGQTQVQVELLEGVIGQLMYIECLKNYLSAHHFSYSGSIIEEVGEYTLIALFGMYVGYVDLPYPISQDNIVEGILTENQTRIQMLNYGKIFFIVLCGLETKLLNQIKVFFTKTQI